MKGKLSLREHGEADYSIFCYENILEDNMFIIAVLTQRASIWTSLSISSSHLMQNQIMVTISISGWKNTLLVSIIYAGL